MCASLRICRALAATRLDEARRWVLAAGEENMHEHLSTAFLILQEVVRGPSVLAW